MQLSRHHKSNILQKKLMLTGLKNIGEIVCLEKKYAKLLGGIAFKPTPGPKKPWHMKHGIESRKGKTQKQNIEDFIEGENRKA